MRRTAKLIRAYRASSYFAGAHAVRIGQRAPALDALLRRWRVVEGVFMAAGNPFSRRMAAGWNARRHAVLRERLQGCDWNKAAIAAAIKEVLTSTGLKMPVLAMPVRVLVMGSTQTPSVDAMLALCDREKVLKRLSDAQ